MKNKLRQLSTFTVVLLALLAFSASAGPNWYTLINGNNYTNYNLKVGATGTNSAGQFTNNVQTGVVLANTTNNYNTFVGSSGASGSSYALGSSQFSTNLWPLCGVSMSPGYPNTLYGPSKTVCLYNQYSFVSTNSTGTNNVVYNFSTSLDGTNIANTNFFSWTCTSGTNITGFAGATNITCPFPFLLLTSVVNTNAVAVTNNLLEGYNTPGF